VKAAGEANPFNLEDLVVKPGEASAGVAPGAKTSRRKGATRSAEAFVPITAKQADLLSRATHVTTQSVFLHLMFRSFKVYHKPFVLRADALAYAGIGRVMQWRALRDLARLGLILVERGSPRSPPIVTIVGVTKQP
jgi:hypothetical protein